MDMKSLKQYGIGLFGLSFLFLMIRAISAMDNFHFFLIICAFTGLGIIFTSIENILSSGMEGAGWLTFSIGFIISSVSALNVPKHPTLSDVYLFTTGCIISIAGLILLKLNSKNQASDEKRKNSCMNAASTQSGDVTQDNYKFDPKVTLNHIIYFLEQLKLDDDPEKIQDEIEKIQFYQIAPFVQNRYKLTDEMGLDAFTHMFSSYATGERHLNRAWSAIVDGYKKEAFNSIKVALENFKDSLKSF